MIYAISSIEVKPEQLLEFVQLLRQNAPKVRAASGCLGYEPTVDVASGLVGLESGVRPGLVTVVESWESMEAFRTHLEAVDTIAFNARVRDMVVNVSIEVLRPA
jgi:quinol monooxygenase YgiN